MIKKCKYCGKQLTYDVFNKEKKFCNRKCYAKYESKHPPKSVFKKGNELWKLTPGHKHAKQLKPFRFSKGKKHPNWKGEKAKVAAKHQWLYRHYGQPKKCELCGSTKRLRYEWANVSGKYKRNRSDYLRLCRQCHTRFDNIIEKALKTKRKRYGPSLRNSRYF